MNLHMSFKSSIGFTRELVAIVWLFDLLSVPGKGYSRNPSRRAHLNRYVRVYCTINMSSHR